MTESERTALWLSLKEWRDILTRRHRLPDNQRMALIVKHDVAINGRM